MQDFADEGLVDYPQPPVDDVADDVGVRLRGAPPRWPLAAAVLAAAVVLVTVVAAMLPSGHAARPATPAPTHDPAATVVAGPDQAALGKLAGAMKGEAVVAQGGSPTPPAQPGPPPSDSAPDPDARREDQPHDASPYDAAPAPLPVNQLMFSPIPVERDYLGDAGRRAHPRAAWDSFARGAATARREAIDRAGTLVEQGDMDAGRAVLSPLVAAGDPLAAFASAETYDPARLRAWNESTDKADVAKARDLYGKAKAGGVIQAGPRIEALP